jgi:hypothetical protein
MWFNRRKPTLQEQIGKLEHRAKRGRLRRRYTPLEARVRIMVLKGDQSA